MVAVLNIFRTHFVDGHQLRCCVLLVLVERYKLDISWLSGLISERWGDSIEIMGAYCNKLSPSADVLMQFVLQVDERGVGARSKLDVPQDSTCE